jgi:pimeloyl-ACP methyl ester carboxylesterase
MINRHSITPPALEKRTKKMRHSLIGIFSLFVVLTFFPLTILSSQSPSPPPHPDKGPGGKQYAHADVTKNRYGEGSREYWIYEPTSPRPATAPLIVFIHGWTGTNPRHYGAWLDHLVRRGNIVIYPRYQTNWRTPVQEFTDNTINAIKDGIRRLQAESGHVRPELNKFAVVGHSVGGILTASVTALAHDSGLPQVRAMMSVQPARTWAPMFLQLADLSKIPSDTLLLSIAGDQDTGAYDTDARRIYYESTRVPESNKNFVLMVSDSHGQPELKADHHAPLGPDQSYDNGEKQSSAGGDKAGVLRGRLRERMNEGNQSATGTRAESRSLPNGSQLGAGAAVDAFDYYGLWKLFDALCDAAFVGKNREYALGNPKQQRFMGIWSDGVPVRELVLTRKP